MLGRILRRRSGPSECPEGTYPVLEGPALLEPHRPRLDRIQRKLGLPDAHWQHFYLGLFGRYACFCQLFPASEAHHHSDPGGLLRHGLETVEHALDLRSGKLLPPGAEPEDITRYQEAWTWGVVTAALLHDIGKPVADLVVEVCGDPERTWDPWTHPTLIETGATCYRIRYRKDRSYRFHEKLGLLLAERILPPDGLRWLASHRPLFAQWVALLGGDHEQAPDLVDLVLPAEQQSVATDLGNERPRAVSRPTARPLSERLIMALRLLIDEGTLPVNRDGAAAWADEDSLWLVSKRGLDAIREQMNQEGQTGVPGRNDRLMDELQQHGWLIPNGDRAVWKARVFADGWAKAHELTFLRFPLARIWPDPERRPEPFHGEILAEASEPNRSMGDDPTAETDTADTASHAQHEAAAAMDTATGMDEAAPEPATEETSRADNDPTDTENPESPSAEAEVEPTHASAPARTETPEGDAPEPTPADAEPSDSPISDAELGTAFLEWLRAGLRERRFQVNNAHARLHRVPEGLLLVSPGIFRDFDGERWNKVQRRFQRLKVNRKTPEGTNIWTYRIQPGGKRIKGFLIQDTAEVLPGIDLPAPNPHLVPEHGKS